MFEVDIPYNRNKIESSYPQKLCKYKCFNIAIVQTTLCITYDIVKMTFCYYEHFTLFPDSRSGLVDYELSISSNFLPNLFLSLTYSVCFFAFLPVHIQIFLFFLLNHLFLDLYFELIAVAEFSSNQSFILFSVLSVFNP